MEIRWNYGYLWPKSWFADVWGNQNFVFGVHDLQCLLHEYQAPANGLWRTCLREVSFEGDGVIKYTNAHPSLRKRLRPSLKSFVELACTVNYRSTGLWGFVLDIIIDLTCLYMLIACLTLVAMSSKRINVTTASCMMLSRLPFLLPTTNRTISNSEIKVKSFKYQRQSDNQYL